MYIYIYIYHVAYIYLSLKIEEIKVSSQVNIVGSIQLSVNFSLKLYL